MRESSAHLWVERKGRPLRSIRPLVLKISYMQMKRTMQRMPDYEQNLQSFFALNIFALVGT